MGIWLTLIRLWVQCPDHKDCEHVDTAEDVESILAQPFKDCRKEKHLLHPSADHQVHTWGWHLLLTHHPFPIDQPTTPQALPFARICSGKICIHQHVTGDIFHFRTNLSGI